MRYMCICKYDGTNFNGFQVQNKPFEDIRTVQGEIEKALAGVLKEETPIIYASRTDEGVHAIGQVFTFDAKIDILEYNMGRAINSMLPDDIFVSKVIKVSDDFHPRYHCKMKEYHYIINLGEYDPLLRNYMYFPRRKKLDINAMKKASKYLIGKHNFKSFCKSSDITNYEREIYEIKLEKKEDVLTVKIKGNGFLRHMVRILVAMLLEVGVSNYSPQDLKSILEQKNRRFAPKILPSSGLYLFKVFYDEEMLKKP